jgi:hypothetical protein
MLKIIKKLIGVFNTVFVRWVHRIRAAFKSKGIEQVTMSDAYFFEETAGYGVDELAETN